MIPSNLPHESIPFDGISFQKDVVTSVNSFVKPLAVDGFARFQWQGAIYV